MQLFEFMSDEEQRIGIMHAGFAMTALPHRATTETVWERQSGDVKLLLESGRTSATELIGLPYGSVARMILLYLQTEAVRTRSRDVELGRSMNTWLNSMGMGNGGHNYNLVREQSRRLSLCRLTFLRVSAKQTFITNGSFVHDAILPNDDTDDYQLQFWKPCVRLDEGFYKSSSNIHYLCERRRSALSVIARWPLTSIFGLLTDFTYLRSQSSSLGII